MFTQEHSKYLALKMTASDIPINGILHGCYSSIIYISVIGITNYDRKCDYRSTADAGYIIALSFRYR